MPFLPADTPPDAAGMGGRFLPATTQPDKPHGVLTPADAPSPLAPLTGIVDPALNLTVLDPIRAAAADVSALVRSGGGTDPEAFWKEREGALAESQKFFHLPESQFGQRVVRAPVEALGGIVASGAHGIANWLLGPDAVAGIGPYAQVGADAAPFIGAAKLATPVATTLTARAATTSTAEKPFSEIIAEGNADRAADWIDRAYSRAVGPSTTGHDTPLQRRQAISEVIANKANLEYTNASGKVAGTARTPNSLHEFNEAITQTNNRLVATEHELEDAAGVHGAQIDPAPVTLALRAMATHASTLRIAPETAREALALADRYERGGMLSPREAAEDLTNLNDKLRGYYQSRPPSADAEEVAARTLRQQLYQAVPGVEDLRRRQGSLQAIREDVQRASRRVANWRAGGGIMGPVGNVAAVGETARGLATHHLADVAAGAAIKAGTKVIRRHLDPDRMVQRIFERAEKHLTQPKPPSPALRQPMTGGLQPPRPTDRSGIPGPQRDAAPPLPGGTTAPGAYGPPSLPRMPPQLPRTDFEDLMGGGNLPF